MASSSRAHSPGRRRARPALMLLALACWPACCSAAAAGSVLGGYMIGPSSYLDVLPRQQQQQQGSSAGTLASSTAGAGPAPASAAAGGMRGAAAPGSAPVAAAPPSRSSGGGTGNSSAERLAKPFNVCVSDWVPMVRCSPDQDPSEFKGYQVELFRMLADRLGWGSNDFSLSCSRSYSAMVDDLLAPNGSCSLSAAGVPVFPQYLAAGLKFSWPTFRGGLRVMIYAHLQSGSTWAFSQVFHWSVWVALGGTSVAVGLLIALLEWASPKAAASEQQHGRAGGNISSSSNSSSSGPGWQSWLWYSLAKVAHVLCHVGDPSTDASRVLVLGYSFLVLVMVSMYTASSASRITAEKLVSPIHSKRDLPGRRVLTWDKYVDVLATRHGITATGAALEGKGDFQAMLAALRAGTYDALVLDSAVLEYTAGTNDDCDLFVVGEPFETSSLALAFPADFDDATVFALSSSIVALQTHQGALDMMENVYVKTGGTSKCFGSKGGGGHASGETIMLRQVAGLWYILLAAIAACFLLTLLHNLRKDPRQAAAVRQIAFRMSLNGFLHGHASADGGSTAGLHAGGSYAGELAHHQQQQHRRQPGAPAGGGRGLARGGSRLQQQQHEQRRGSTASEQAVAEDEQHGGGLGRIESFSLERRQQQQQQHGPGEAAAHAPAGAAPGGGAVGPRNSGGSGGLRGFWGVTSFAHRDAEEEQ